MGISQHLSLGNPAKEVLLGARVLLSLAAHCYAHHLLSASGVTDPENLISELLSKTMEATCKKVRAQVLYV